MTVIMMAMMMVVAVIVAVIVTAAARITMLMVMMVMMVVVMIVVMVIGRDQSPLLMERQGQGEAIRKRKAPCGLEPARGLPEDGRRSHGVDLESTATEELLRSARVLLRVPA